MVDIINNKEQWDLVISPKRSWWDLRLRELWRYRDLVILFVRRDFVAHYKQTILGPLWYIIQPLLSTIVFTIVFGRIANLPTDGTPDFLFYLSGQVIWGYFAKCFIDTSSTFTANAGIFGKVYFPRMVTPVSKIFSAMIGFGIQYLTFLGFLFYFILHGADISPNWTIIFTPVYILIMAGLGLGGGIVISSLTTKYRDFQMLIAFGVQLLMYATPVIYPASTTANNPVLRTLLFLNPITVIIEAFRYSYLGQGMIPAWAFLYSVLFTVSLVFVGMALFNRVEQNFMDTV